VTVIKICDVRKPEVASFCASCGAEMIGLHCIWHPPSGEKLATFQDIFRVVQGRCKCVLVTRQKDIPTIIDMIQGMAWDYIQLHSDWALSSINQLRARLSESGRSLGLIGVIEISMQGITRIKKIAEATDILLLDSSIRGGSGTSASSALLEQAVSHIQSKPFLIAGGLREENVSHIIEKYHPWGVDVQSGVEKPGGSREKDFDMIRGFISTVRSPTR
jgi:phosphoribosylanthranilate isomerase